MTGLACAPCALAASGGGAPEATQQAIGYPTLFLLVLVGALVPVVPTGALVSSAAAVAFHHSDPVASSLLVFAVAAGAAFGGDALLFALGRRGVRSRGGSRWLAWISGQVPPQQLARARQRLAHRGTALLVVSRLVPAGRVPVMLACLLAGMSPRLYLRGAAAAALGWAAAYQLIGLLGGAVFPHPWQGVAAAVALTVLIAAAPGVWRRLRPPAAPAAPSSGSSGSRDGVERNAGHGKE